MACLFCDQPNPVHKLLELNSSSFVGQICRACQQDAANRTVSRFWQAANGHYVIDGCNEPGDYAIGKHKEAISGLGTADTRQNPTQTSISFICTDHFDEKASGK